MVLGHGGSNRSLRGIAQRRGRIWDRRRIDGDGMRCGQSRGLRMQDGGLIDGRERRRGTWWDRRNNCIAVEGIDFAQDTQEGGADEFDFIPDSDEDLIEDVVSSEFVPDSLVEEVDAGEEDEGRGTSVLVSNKVEALVVGDASMEGTSAIGIVDNPGDKEVLPVLMSGEVETLVVGAMDESADGDTDEVMTGWVDSQEDEYEDLDNFKLEMLRLMMPVTAWTTYMKGEHCDQPCHGLCWSKGCNTSSLSSVTT
ncbi:unnamed protein product [Urochloa humidicola]